MLDSNIQKDRRERGKTIYYMAGIKRYLIDSNTIFPKACSQEIPLQQYRPNQDQNTQYLSYMNTVWNTGI